MIEHFMHTPPISPDQWFLWGRKTGKVLKMEHKQILLGSVLPLVC
jgi:hypothetical protein